VSLSDEADDFISIWDETHEVNPVDPREIDWDELESWAVGNSTSFDQSRIKTGRVIMQLLVNRRLLWLKQQDIAAGGDGDDSFRDWPEHPMSGTGDGFDSYTEEPREDDEPQCANCLYFRSIGDDAYGICSLWDHKAAKLEGYILGHCNSHTSHGSGGRVSHYSPHRGGIKRKDIETRCGSLSRKGEGRVALRILNWLHSNDFVTVTDNDGAEVPATDDFMALGAHLFNDATIRLAQSWDVYIRGRNGSRANPADFPQLHRGEMENSLAPVVLVDIPIVLGELVNRLVSERSGKTGIGENQYTIRADICDLAYTRNPPYVTVGEYYEIFKNPISGKSGAPHMADTYLHRAAQDQNAAVFSLTGQYDPPDYGHITVDDRLMRWRERARDRGR
jgi:hypothetical protein